MFIVDEIASSFCIEEFKRLEYSSNSALGTGIVVGGVLPHLNGVLLPTGFEVFYDKAGKCIGM